MVGTRVIDAREVVGNEKCRVALKCLKRSERRNGGRIKNDYGKVGCVLLSEIFRGTSQAAGRVSAADASVRGPVGAWGWTARLGFGMIRASADAKVTRPKASSPFRLPSLLNGHVNSEHRRHNPDSFSLEERPIGLYQHQCGYPKACPSMCDAFSQLAQGLGACKVADQRSINQLMLTLTRPIRKPEES